MSWGSRPEALHDWNTTFPANVGQVTEIADALGAQGFDVHTVKIQLNNGDWVAEFESTDEDMQDHVHEFELSSSGHLERV